MKLKHHLFLFPLRQQDQNNYPAPPHGPGPANTMVSAPGNNGMAAQPGANAMAGNHGNAAYMNSQAAAAAAALLKQQQHQQHQQQILEQQKQQQQQYLQRQQLMAEQVSHTWTQVHTAEI